MRRIIAIGIQLLAVTACADPAAEPPPPALLCAAEALKAARQGGLALVEQDLLRARAAMFASKVAGRKQEEVWRDVDRLADQERKTPLIGEATCTAIEERKG